MNRQQPACKCMSAKRFFPFVRTPPDDTLA
jgi:hypothetical protein